MQRRVQSELLDVLPPGDPRAMRARRDLRRVNACMGNAEIMAAALRNAFPTTPPHGIADLGAGDGRFMLVVARRLNPHWMNTCVTLVDRQCSFNGATARFAELGWPAHAVTADATDWVRSSKPEAVEMLVANLFLHHFSEAQLATLFSAVSNTALAFVAVEPRRSALSLVSSRMLWLIGCSAVTRHDATVSVRAGFAGRELSTLWPDREGWQLIERRAGVFSHLFIARRKG